MGIIKSTVVTMSGMHMLADTLRNDVAHGLNLTVADKHAAAYLTGVGVADQYPTRVQGDYGPNAGFESLAGKVADLVA